MDDTPEVKWSNAWWGWLLLGLITPPILACCALVSFWKGSAYAIGLLKSEIKFVPVLGFQADLMALAYLGAAIAAFAYGYARHSPRLSQRYEGILLAGLVICAVGVAGCSAIFYTG